jgi:hypothetical protein
MFGAFLSLPCLATAATFQEDFSNDPVTHGWQVFGNTNLFHWDATNQNLLVTWDSSQPNSYFHRPLGTILGRDDDFSLGFDVRFSDVAVGVNSNKSSTFEIAINLLNLARAAATNFLRGSGIDATFGPRNLVEFDYFPDSGFGATVSPTVVSSNNQFASTFNFPLEMTANDLFHILMTYTAANQTLVTSMTRNGAPFGPVQNVVLAAGFTDFRVDNVAVASYSDEGQDPQYGGSLLAHGVVDNFVVTTPPPPVAALTGGFSNTLWQVKFLSRSNWLYTLERTADFQSWAETSQTIAGNGANLFLADTNALPGKAFYRVHAEKP